MGSYPRRLLELRDHVVGPVLRSGFPAVVDDVADAALPHLVGADRFFVTVEVLFHVLPNVFAVQLVHFEAGSFRGRGMIRDAQQASSRSAERPSCPGGGVQSSVPSGRIFDVRSITSDFFTASSRSDGRGGKAIQIRLGHKGGLLLEVVDARARDAAPVRRFHNSLGAGGILNPNDEDRAPRPRPAAAEAASRRKVTRKYFAVTAGKGDGQFRRFASGELA